jgi:hypothetical protein
MSILWIQGVFRVGAVVGLLLALAFVPEEVKAQAFPPVYSSSSHYVAGDQVQLNGNVFRAVKAVAGHSPASDVTDWELNLVRSSTTLMIGAKQEFSTLAAAWAYAQNARVADGAYLHFYISSQSGPFNEQFQQTFLLDHASGARLAIIGDSVANDAFLFNGSNGFTLDSCHAFNTISGVSIQNQMANDTTFDAIRVNSSAALGIASNVNFIAFNDALHAFQGGTATIGSNCQFTSLNNGLMADGGGIIIIAGDISISAATYGLAAQYGGIIEGLPSSVPTITAPMGLFAATSGVIILNDPQISNCTIFGCEAWDKGCIYLHQGTVSGNRVDLNAWEGGYIDAYLTFYSSAADNFSTDGSLVD